MTTPLIHIDGHQLIDRLDTYGWTQHAWKDEDGAICAHQAIRLCAPSPGDAHLVEKVAESQGWGTAWNDADDTTEAEVRARLAQGVDVTDEDLEDTFGPQWRAIVSIVRTAATMTADQSNALADGRSWPHRGPVGPAYIHTAAMAASEAALTAVWAVRDAAWAAAAWHMADPDGPFTPADRDQLMAPWEAVFGLPDGLERNEP